MNRALPWWFAWLAFSVLTAGIAMLYSTAAIVDGEYTPVSNDSFYHARRIIDAAIGDRGFYQFDPWIHAPDGSWLNWPWAYDLLLAQALRVALWIKPGLPPMQFLAYVPVAWSFVNIGLLTLIARQLRLPVELAAIGLLAIALLPLTQNLHGLGLIDHHFVELTFVLLTVLFGLRFFAAERQKDAIILGTTLGLAVAFHNGLFILQVPVLAAACLLWLRSVPTRNGSTPWLAGSLFVTTLLVVLPSEPVYDGQFEFWTLSWFHLYVAMCSALVLGFLAWRPCSRLNIGLLLALGLLLVAPMLARLLTGAAFLSGDLEIIRNITEVQSPVARLFSPDGFTRVSALYSWLIFLAPPVFLLQLFRLFRKQAPEDLFLSVIMIFGIALMLSQYRLHPFGSWAIVFGALLAIEELRQRFALPRLGTGAATLALLAVALQPSLRQQLFVHVPPGLDRDYAASRSVYPRLAQACRAQPGVVLSLPDDGHPIRYHTECSVLVNNFLMTPQHMRKLAEKDRLLQMSPAELRRETDIRYVFVRIDNVFYSTSDAILLTPLDVLKDATSPLFSSLAFSDELPTGFKLLDEVRVEDDRDFAYARVVEILRD